MNSESAIRAAEAIEECSEQLSLIGGKLTVKGMAMIILGERDEIMDATRGINKLGLLRRWFIRLSLRTRAAHTEE